jgi:hypothetical protein
MARRQALGVTSAQDYKGIVVNIGASYLEKPYTPKLMSIVQNSP